jgi:hypothetical protein
MAWASAVNCPAGDVPCLINAINAANANSEEDTINLEAGTYTLSAAASGGPSGPNGLPVISSPITLHGAGAGATSVQRDPALDQQSPVPLFRIFEVSPSGSLTLESLSIQHGHSGDGSGGGILNFGAVKIVDSDVRNNASEFGSGGGISNAATLQLTESRVSNNGASTAGGIDNAGTMTINQCTVSDNGADEVGGIRNSGVATITNSSITDNTALIFGSGGIENEAGTITLTNVTVARNGGGLEASLGGGIANSAGGTIHINNSTIADNSVPDSGPGGIGNDSGTVELKNTILARNELLFPESFPFDCAGVITSLGHNLVGDTSLCTITILASDYTGDPGLSLLQDEKTPGNGHIPLLETSQAVDAGDPVSCTATDQLGHSRSDGDGNGTVVCDIGSVELVVPEIVNELVSVIVTKTSFDDTLVTSGPAGTFTIEARLTNISSNAIHDPIFRVSTLTGTNRLLNADGGPGGVGATLTPDVGADDVLASGESITATFVIGLTTRRRFSFFVDVLGVPGP